MQFCNMVLVKYLVVVITVVVVTSGSAWVRTLLTPLSLKPGIKGLRPLMPLMPSLDLNASLIRDNGLEVPLGDNWLWIMINHVRRL